MKIVIAFLLSFILMSSSVSVMAQEALVRNGYTDEGMYYELYFKVIHEDVSICSEGVRHVTLKVTYDSITIPQETMYWSELVDGEEYAGYLSLKTYHFSGNKTIATYVGDLYKQ